jgi:UDP-2-acetamido-3-amino-2,3-dideoxy-glucuronate N-acetyltransferase
MTATENAYYVHPSSIIDDGAIIGTGTKIWHFCHVFRGAKIGRNCILGQGCSVSARAVIGDRCKLQNGISLYDGVTLEDEVFCGPHMIFTNVITPRAFIERKTEFRPTRVGRGATLGAGAVIVCGVQIGRYALIGAGAVVTRNVPPFALVYGNPARVKGYVSRCGNRLEFNADGMALGADGVRYHRRGDVVVPEDEA